MGEEPLIVGHRGAPGYRPEHSLDSYRLAIRQGADAVETDIVMSRDGVPVVRHESELSRTTDVAGRRRFRDRRTTREIDGKSVTGWFTEDFSLKELLSLGAPTRQHPILTLDRLIRLIEAESARAGRRIGLHIEVKHPGHFEAIGLPVAPALLPLLRMHGLEAPSSRAWIQSFDPGFVRDIAERTAVPRVQLVSPAWGRIDPGELADIAGYAQALGPKKSMVRPKGQPPTGLVEDAHEAGLKVFTYTLRKGEGQARRFFEAGVDGVFTDYPDRCVSARAALRAEASRSA